LCAPQGRLVYATCSTSRAENEDQVQAFLGRHPEFVQVNSLERLAQQGVGLPEHWQAWADGGAMRLWPHRTETDGFYGAMLVKRPV
jgi:16S rRNA (cytosine967-C5)-methyltransferase